MALSPEKASNLLTGSKMRIDSSQKAYYCLKKWMASDVEEFWALALSPSLELIDKKLLFRGTVDSCLVHPRDLVRFVCQTNATSFVIAHNHPSGYPKPSKSDIQVTKKLYQVGRLMEIPLNDHIILSGNTYFSFADHGLLVRFNKIKSMSLR